VKQLKQMSTTQVSINEASELLSAIIASSGDAIISADLNGNLTGWNPAAQRLFGFTAEEAIGQSVAALLSPEHLRPEVAEVL
jgi:PAS domain S-box-containing protein